MSFKLATPWPHLALVVLSAIVAVKTYQNPEVFPLTSRHIQTIPDIAMLASIEPAGGHEAPVAEGADGEPAPKKSFTGKDLTGKSNLPLVTIGSTPIQTSEELKKQEQEADLGELAENAAATNLISRAWRITPYAHNPTRGREDALVHIIEFSDLSCAQCMPYLAKEDEWLKAHADQARQTQIHSPVGEFQDINLAAFYGKIAQRGGTFWKYREALITLEDPTPEKYFNTLLATGIDRALARRLLNTESRRMYRELDADANLARKLHIGEPPSFVVNTIMLGQQGVPLDNVAAVLTYQLNAALREQRLKPNDTAIESATP